MNLLALILAGIAFGGWLALLFLYSRLQNDLSRTRSSLLKQLEKQNAIQGESIQTMRAMYRESKGNDINFHERLTRIEECLGLDDMEAQ